MSRTRANWWVAVAVTAGLALSAPAGPAEALTGAVVESGAVTLPAHRAEPALTLVGASSVGFAVEQSVPAGEGLIYTGAVGSTLTARPLVRRDVSSYRSWLGLVGVVGDTLAWARQFSGSNSTSGVVHRMNILTGEDVEDGRLGGIPFGFTGPDWLAFPDMFSEVPFLAPTLRRYPAGVASDPETGMVHNDLLVLADRRVNALAVDHDDVLMATEDDADNTAEPDHLDLIDTTSGSVTRRLDTSESIEAAALSPQTVAWVTMRSGAAGTIHQQPRTGGAAVSFIETDARADVDHLVAGSGEIAYLVTGSDQTRLRVVTGASAHDVVLPKGSAGLVALDGSYFTAAGGSPAVAGVYRVDGDTVTRVATLPDVSYPVLAWDFSGSRLTWIDQSLGGPTNLPVWRRTVSGAGSLRLSGPTRLKPRAAGVLGEYRPATAFSGGRAVIGSQENWNRWQLVDRNTVTAVVEQRPVTTSRTPRVSGPYSLISGHVFRPYGEVIYTEPAAVKHDDLYGSSLVYAVKTGSAQSRVYLVDTETRHRRTVATLPCAAAPPVSTWAGAVAWLSCDQATITVKGPGTTRRLATGYLPATGGGVRLTLGEGTLGWVAGKSAQVVDLTDPTSAPVALAGATRSLVLDDHRLARQLYAADGLDPNGPLTVQSLPFDPQTYRPRLLGTLTRLAFTPDGDHHSDTWTAQFDVTKPLSRARLRITSAKDGHLVRVLDTTAPDGSVRGLTWDGRSDSGAGPRIGVYRWELTGTAADGDGSLVGRVTGSVEIDAVSRK